MNSILLPSYHIGYKILREGAIKPSKAYKYDAGWDLYSNEDVEIFAGKRTVVKTGISLEIPEEYVGLIWPRSGLSVKQGIDVLAGVIDSTYRGEIMVCLYNTDRQNIVAIKKGDRIAQILFQKVPHFELIESELTETERKDKAFGSSGR